MDYEVCEKTYNKSVKYIKARMEGLNKTQSKIVAGYSPKSNSLVEHTKAYALALQNILAENNNKMRVVGDVVSDKIDNNELEKLSIDKVVDIQLKLAQIHKILTPTVTIKEETDAKGNKKITKWGSTSYESAETQD